MLVDAAGHVVARYHPGAEAAVVRPHRPRVAETAAQDWHLWGLSGGANPPVYLGALRGDPLTVPHPERFQGFAISLETRGFSDSRPRGPVIALTLSK